jgi:succinate-semialdehyde dehydrogenase/glutarate-semialdehyde dehydrogenase
LKWDSLIRENKDDLAKIVTYETGKPIAESLGELDYALGFTWWFAGEAERITGTIQVGNSVIECSEEISPSVAMDKG